MVGSGVKVGKQLSLGADLIRVVGNAAHGRAAGNYNNSKK